MNQTNIVALLSRKSIEKFSSLIKERGLTQRDVFLEALSHFKNLLSQKKHYEFKHQDIDRINNSLYTIVVFEYTFLEVEELRKKFDIGSNRLLREIICEYLDSQTD